MRRLKCKLNGIGSDCAEMRHMRIKELYSLAFQSRLSKLDKWTISHLYALRSTFLILCQD